MGGQMEMTNTTGLFVPVSRMADTETLHGISC